MALTTGGFSTTQGRGLREHLADTIYMIDPVETPVMSGSGRGKAEAVSLEWQTDALAAAAVNAQLEGDDPTVAASSATTRVANRLQIFYKTLAVTGTMEEVKKAGRTSEVARQLRKRSQEIKRDIELTITGNYASVSRDDTTAGKIGSLEAWIKTNVDIGTGAAANGGWNGSQVAARTDGTTRAFAESQVKTVLQLCWTNGAKITHAICGGTQKQNISAIAGPTGTQRNNKASDRKLYSTFDVYVGDFYDVMIVPDRFSRNRTILFVDFDMLELAYLRSFRKFELAKTGDSTRWMLLAELTLKVGNEKGLGGIFDLT